MNQKVKSTIYLSDRTNKKLDTWYRNDGSRTKSDFIENAIDFYIDSHVLDNCGVELPLAISSAIDGRLGMFENRIASILFKQAVEIGILTHILAPYVEQDELGLNALRGKCVRDVKRTNGYLTLANIVKQHRTLE